MRELTTVVWTGGGAGTGTVMPSCEAGCWYAKGQQVAITAIPDPFNILSFWLGDCVGYALETSVTMDAARSCTAAFSPCFTMVSHNTTSGIYSASVQALYELSSTDNGHTLRLIATTIVEDLLFDKDIRQVQTPVDITLQGGWSCGYFARDFLGSLVQGTVTIKDGSVTFDGIVIL